MNVELARKNMLTQQLKAWGVLDEQILNLAAQIPRECFLPPAYRNIAFADMNIPLTHGQITLTPKEEARLIQTLAIRPSDHILEVGTGCGYTTALLACLGHYVYSVDIFPDFSRAAQLKLAALNICNVTLLTADAANSCELHAPFDVVVITGSLPYVPEFYLNCLKSGGRLFVILGQAPAMEATLITRIDKNNWHTEKLFETVIPPLINAPTLSKFNF